jgi:hypothetical protein
MICAMLVLGGTPDAVQANDSSAELSVGGLVFKHNADVSMESEELTISAETITVRYKFLNKSANPVTLTVAFPLPDIDLSDADNVAIPTSDPVNFVGFQTKIDGQPVTFDIVQRAFLGDKDVSEAVRNSGLPLLPLGVQQERIAALPEPVRERMINEGLFIPAGSDERGRQLYTGSWVVKTSIVREQTFPAGRPVLVEHQYRTSVGVSFDTVLRKAVRESKGMERQFQKYRADYCIPDSLLRGIDLIAGSDEANVANLQEHRISYVLKTGANWSGPIKDFRLVIDKGRRDRLTSFCANNVRKISPTAFEVRAKDFTPDRDLKILIVGKRD